VKAGSLLELLLHSGLSGGARDCQLVRTLGGGGHTLAVMVMLSSLLFRLCNRRICNKV